MNTSNYDCPVCHDYRGNGSSLGQHIWQHKKKGLFTGKIDWSLRSYVKNGAAIPKRSGASVSHKKKVVEKPLIDRYNDLLIQVDLMKNDLAEEKLRLDAQSSKIQALLVGTNAGPTFEQILK